jgi:hypothetical protein
MNSQPIGYVNDTSRSTSLVSDASFRAYEPKIPMIPTLNFSFRNGVCFLSISTISCRVFIRNTTLRKKSNFVRSLSSWQLSC